MSTSLKICVIENGRTPDDLIDQFGSYPEMISAWIGPALPEAVFTFVSPVAGEKLPKPYEYDGYILSGSKFSTYERTPWMLALIVFLQQLRAEKIPVFGICFGHQIMADAFGGLTEKCVRGWGVGAQLYEYKTERLPAQCSSFIFHQDQVNKVPPEATVIGGSLHCPHGVFEYAFPALSVQYHPEFSAAYITALARKFRGNLLPDSVSASALSSIDRLAVDAHGIAEWAAAFFRSHVRSFNRHASLGEPYAS
ncbi:type 1 glutamine amidotransferase [Pseudomonas sp. KU43P]|uniref:type 1 glutamine amidotransferase n=1 Tax=Pseudomonas sp. KU43P TaxID=2487887 RepID=UPI0012A7A3D2|nr:type 1 glutamine amidotransferase [Pseudomonas sp. KU43P]BBH45764.1 GMP synthase [Pseudomonas sp. KU43P]